MGGVVGAGSRALYRAVPSELEKALFPDGFDDDDEEALASVVRGRK